MAHPGQQARLTLVNEDIDRGQAAAQIADRMVRLGFSRTESGKAVPSVRALYNWSQKYQDAPLDRGTIKGVLKGTSTPKSILRVFAALDAFAEETGETDPEPPPSPAAPERTVRVTVKGPSSAWEVVYEGGPADLPEMNAAAEDLIRKRAEQGVTGLRVQSPEEG